MPRNASVTAFTISELLGLKKIKKSSIPIPQLIDNKREHLERLKVRLKGSVAYE